MGAVWITGASSGIGKACALRYAAQKRALVLTSSSREKLEAVARECLDLGAVAVTVLPCDLRNSDGIDGLVREAWRQSGGIDTMFCNAGVSQRTTVLDTSMETVRELMEINYFAPVQMAKSILPFMLDAGGGTIAVTTSIAGRFGFPLRCAYSSSKHALYGFFETLRAEYYSKGIRVTIVCPGRVRTDISLNARDKGGRPHGTMDPGQASGLSPEKAAKRIVRAIDHGRREVLVGRGELLMVQVKRFLPGLCAWIGRHISAV